jgi:formylglycine-generating enzyme required for sulfatase activity
MRFAWVGALLAFGCLMQSAMAQNTAVPKVVKDCPQCPEMVLIPAGTFVFGTDDAKRKKIEALFKADGSDNERNLARYMEFQRTPRVVEMKPFFASRYMIKRKDFELFAEEEGYHTDRCIELGRGNLKRHPADGWRQPGFPQSDNDPVTCISYEEAQRYVDWLNRKYRQSHPDDRRDVIYRIPDEIELEYVIGGGRSTLYWWGDVFRKNELNCWDCGGEFSGGTTPVDKFSPNNFGIFDPLGNLWQMSSTCAEWEWDRMDRIMAHIFEFLFNEKNYCFFVVEKGGSWSGLKRYAYSSATASTNRRVGFNTEGLRIVRDAKQEEMER